MKLSQRQLFWLLLILCIATLWPFLGLYDYNTKGEPRESIVSYSILETGNWILSRNNGGEMAYKPPFFHWCIAAVSYVWGGVTEATSRFPSMVALIALVMSSFSFFAKRKDSLTALVTAVICLTCFELHRAGMNCRIDMLLTALTCGVLFMLYRWYERGCRGVPIIAILLMSVGTMTKGPVGALVPCMCMGAFLLLAKPFSTNFAKNFLASFFSMLGFSLLAFILPAFWYYAAWQQGGQEFYDLMWEENIGRMTNTMSYNSCVEPWYFPFITLLYGFLPFTLLLVFAVFSLKGIRKSSLPFWKGIGVGSFALVCAVVITVFYCIPQSKRSVYLMPAYPFIAYFIARFMIWLAESKKASLKVFGWVIWSISVILLITTILLKFRMIPETIFSGHHAEQNILILHNLEDINGFIVWLSIAIVVLSCIYWVKSKKVLFPLLFLIVALNVGLDGAWKPAALNAKSMKSVATEIDQYAPENAGTLYEYIEGGVIAKGDPVHFFEINFYLQHPNRLGNFYKERPQSGFLLILEEDFKKHEQEFQSWGYRMNLVRKTNNKVWGQPLYIVKFVKN